MSTAAGHFEHVTAHPVRIHVEPQLEGRNRLTTAFRLILSVPHLVLVGVPIAGVLSWTWASGGTRGQFGSAGVLGAVAGVCAMIAWFGILFTGTYPEGLRRLVELYLRWRVRAVAYTALLRDEYPPFGDAAYPAAIEIEPCNHARDRLSVGFRLVLAIPHLVAVWALGIAWTITTVIAWFSILFTGRYPRALYEFGVGAMRWSTRVEAYLLLLHDDYPPFSLE